MSDSDLPGDARPFVNQWLGSGWRAARLAGDASVRQYYRLTKGEATYMVAYYPEAVRGGVKRFLEAYRAIESETRVPTLLCHSECAVAQTDVGDETLFDVLRSDRERGIVLYREAIDLLVGFQRAGAAAGGLNPPFTAATFLQELEMACEFYLRQLVHSEEADEPRLMSLMQQLCNKLESHPYVLCHRDYHGQNLHLINDSLYIIDYQDMRMGPDTYDIASLLRDRGVARLLGEAQEDALVEHYRGLTHGDGSLRTRYFEALLQRSIKILGTFAQQALVRGKTHYLDFIAPTLESIARCGFQVEELRPLAELFPIRPVALNSSSIGVSR